MITTTEYAIRIEWKGDDGEFNVDEYHGLKEIDAVLGYLSGYSDGCRPGSDVPIEINIIEIWAEDP